MNSNLSSCAIVDQFQTPGPYAQIDNLSFDFPQMPILTQYREFTDDMTCMQGDFSNADCIDTYCTCPIIYSVELGSLVEMVFIDNCKYIRNNDFWESKEKNLNCKFRNLTENFLSVVTGD